MKVCFRCGQLKESCEFYAHPQMSDGLLGKCKQCTRADTAANRAANPEHYQQYEKVRSVLRHRRELSRRVSRDYRESGRHAIAMAAYIERYPDKYKAHNAVSNAIRDGKLERKPCWCGAKAEAHHPDYSKPLEVVWLCKMHHEEVHHQQERNNHATL